MENKNSFYLIFKQLTLQHHYSVFSWFNLHYKPVDIEDENSVKPKFKCVEKLRDDIFVTPDFHNKMMESICKAQKIYWAFSRVAYKYKRRKAILKIDSDLYLNPIDPSSMYAMDIYQERFIYRFTLQNLIHYIEGAIANTQGFISVPLECKNPYNNIPFSKADLYNIYYRVRKSDLVVPDLFHRFFLCSFHLKLFALENESLIRERAILDYLNKSDSETIYEEVEHMLVHFWFFRIKISEKFPKDELVHIMKPYLYLFFLYKYSTHNPEIRNRSYYLLKNKLDELVKYNPRFGRKYMVKSSSGGFGAKTAFVMDVNKKHPRFTMNCIKNSHYYSNNMYKTHYVNEHQQQPTNYNPSEDQGDEDEETETVVFDEEDSTSDDETVGQQENEDYNDF
jgi:hypothetical protein